MLNVILHSVNETAIKQMFFVARVLVSSCSAVSLGKRELTKMVQN